MFSFVYEQHFLKRDISFKLRIIFQLIIIFYVYMKTKRRIE